MSEGQGDDKHKVEELEAELARERERFDIIFQNTTVSIWDYDFATRRIVQPSRSKELHGFDTVIENVPDSLVESGFVHPDSAQAFLDMYKKLFAGEKHVEGVFRVQTADRAGYWYEHIRYTALQDTQGVSYAAVGMSTDVTEEMESRQAEMRWKELLASTMGNRGAVIEFDLTNDALVGVENSLAGRDASWAGLSFDDYVSAYARNYVYLGDIEMVKQRLDRARLLTEYLDGAREFSLEYRMQHAGVLFWVDLSVTFMRFDNGSIHLLLLHRDITEQKEKEIELQRMADSDPLTGLLNRRAFDERAHDVLSQYDGQQHVLVMADLDGFKDINDNFGHVMGDKVLSHAGRCVAELLERLEAHALCARLSGDEFAVLFYGGDRDEAQRYAEGLLASFDEPVVDGIRLSASIGIAIAPQDGKDLDALSLAADRALYHVKRHGKGGLCFYDSIWHEESGTIQRRQQFLSDAFSGGMMGGYMEEGFPFYFVDDSMLRWLGYADEDEFVQDIDGLVENCMHPDDRNYVSRAVDQQLAHGDRYEVDYRMRKRDGSYIWVHDVGERIVAPDGRLAIMSVCHDITVEKEHANVIQSLVDDANGGIGLYRVEEDWTITLLYASENLAQMAGYNDDEYWTLSQEDALDLVYEADRDAVREAARKAVVDDVVSSLSYRIPQSGGGYTWISGTFSKHGEDQGRPVLRAVYLPLPLQYELQLQSLDTDTLGVYAIDRHTKELYYANDASFRLHDVEACDITGRMCYDVYFGRDSVCDDCILTTAQENSGHPFLHEACGRTVSVEVQDRRWNGKDVAIIYGRDVTDQALEQKRQDELLNRIPAGLCLARLEQDSFEPLVYNSALEKVLGIDRSLDELDPADLLQGYVHPEDLGKLNDYLCECRAQPGSDYACRYRIWNKAKGAYIWIETHANTVYQDGEMLAYSTYADVTDVQQVQDSLRQSQEMMAARLELERKKQQGNDRDLLFYYVANVTEGQISEYRTNMPGTPSMRPGAPLSTFVDEVGVHLAFADDREWMRALYDRERLLDRYHRGLQQEEYRTQMALPDGKIVWTRHALQLLGDPYTKDIMLYEYVHDISREQIAEMLLKLELSSGYEAIGFLIVQEDQFTVLEFGQNGAQPTEQVMSFSDYMRRYAAEWVHPDDRVRFCAHYLERDFAREEPSRTEIVYRVINRGDVEYYQGTLYLYEEDGKRFCTLTRRDYTDIVRTEEAEKRRLADALEKAEEAGRAKNEFLARMSHDMRTPMNAIIGLSALTIDDADDPDEVRANMAKMQTASDFLLSLVNDILDMSKIEDHALSLNVGPYPYREFLLNMRTTFLPQCEAKGISLHFEEPEADPIVMCDKTRLNQVFYNIFSNAVKYTPPGGSIDYHVEGLTIANGRLSANYVIRDTGIGMSEEYQKQMFEPFTRENNEYTAELQGSGLGLGIAKQLVELMGGDIRIDSKKGCGTTVTVSLAFECVCESEGARLAVAAPVQDERSLQGCVVLLAEDNPINAEITSKLLRSQGIGVLHAENGRRAVEIFRASEETSINVVLMDIRMPEMDGLEAAAAIRSLDRSDAKSVPIIALSANAYPEDVHKSMEAGMNAHLSKPMDVDTLFKAIREQLA